MKSLLVKIKNMLPNAQKKVQDKLNRDETIAVLQGMTGFASAIAGKDPFDFINTALDIASYASNAPCRISLDSSLRSINKWMTFGKEYIPLEDSSDLDFSLVDINSVPEIMQVSICHDFEISIVIFMPNITTNHVITYTNTGNRLFLR